jgi:hypothetical protein
MSSALKKWTLCLLLIALAALSAADLLDPDLERAGMGRLHRFNERYLEDAFQKALTGFVILSGIKSGLAVIEGSEVGVGFNLQVGDVVQPLYDYVDIAWRAAMAGGGVIAIMRMALKGLRLIDHWVLTGWLILLLTGYATGWFFPGQTKRWQPGLRNLTRLGANLTIAVYLLLPLTVTAAAALSTRITAPLIAQSHEELRQFGKTLAPDNLVRQFAGQESETGPGLLDLKARLGQVGDGMKTFSAFLTLQTERMAGLILTLLAAYLFDCILFPLFFGLILMTLLRSGVSYLFDLHGRPETAGR